MIYVIIGVVALIVIGVVVFGRRRQQSTDGMTNFRRQIDALSPEARRPVVDQVQRAAVDEPDPPQPDEQDG